MLRLEPEGTLPELELLEVVEPLPVEELELDELEELELVVEPPPEHEPLEVFKPVLAPAVDNTICGTQLAASREYEYGILIEVVDVGFGPAG